MGTKHCYKCDTTKALEEFAKAKRYKDGRQSWCRECQRAHHQANRDIALERMRAYRVANRDEIREQQKEYLRQNRAAKLAWRQAYNQARAAHWAENNPYLDHPTGKKECRRKHGLLPVSRFSRHALRVDGLSDTCRECDHATGETRDDRDAWTQLAKTRPQCIYCNAPSQHVDHVHPVSRGGRDIATNYAPACEPCNLSKNAKWVYDYLFGTEGRPDDEKPAAYQSWDAPFLTTFFAELEHDAVARP